MAITVGEQFECMVSESQQVRLDTENVKKLLDSLLLRKLITQEESESCFMTLDIKTVKTNRRDASLKPKWVAPTLGPNATPEMIVDQLGEVRERMNNDKKTEGFLKEGYNTRMAQLNPQPTNPGEAKTAEEAGFNLYDNSNDD